MYYATIPAKKIKFENMFNSYTSNKLYIYESNLNKNIFSFNNIFVIYLFYLLLFLLLNVKILFNY